MSYRFAAVLLQTHFYSIIVYVMRMKINGSARDKWKVKNQEQIDNTCGYIVIRQHIYKHTFFSRKSDSEFQNRET